MKKKIIKIILLLVIIISAAILSLSYIINNNNNYKDNTIKKINKHYKIDNITYTNTYGNYYILKTKDNVIVLNKEYKEILKEKVTVLAENKDNYELIYRTNKLMYENTILEKDKLTYKYYDAKTVKYINETVMEK